MAATSVISPSTIWSKFQAAYGKPLGQRCIDLEQLILNCSSKDASSILPGLLENIFGFGAEPGWGLDVITKGHNHAEFDAVLRFLGPEGPIMKVVCNLQTDSYLTYEFPFSSLPGPTRHIIEEGSLPMFYVNKLQFQGFAKPAIVIGAFELFMFHFAYALVSQQWQQKSLNWNNMTDVIYPCLLEKYLDYFLPRNKKSLPKFPQSSGANIRSPMVQQSPVSVKQSPVSGTPQTRSRSRLGLLKANLLSTQKPLVQGSPVTEKVEGDIWWSETFVQILAEFWLNQNSIDLERGISLQNLSHSRLGQSSESFLSLYESFMPSNNHVRLVRLFLKHIHFFVNSCEPETNISGYQQMDASPLDEFKRSLISSVLQKKVYSFLRHGFERWPLDSSFRLILETWLTYIQPWRYTEPGNALYTKDADRVPDMWFPFIRDNILFYSALFQDFLQRTRKMYLTSIHNAYIVFRVAKVLNLTNLPQLLREVEKILFGPVYKTDLSGSYIASELSTVLRIQISELERPDFNYISLFGHETESQIHNLLTQINASKTLLSTKEPEKKVEKSKLGSFLSSLFDNGTKMYGDMSEHEVKKLVLYLDQTAHNLVNLFSIKNLDFTIPSSPGFGMTYTHSAGDQSTVYNTSLSTSLSGTPDCKIRNQGPQLTPLGRYQLMNGLRKFDVVYHGDPDLQPIRSYENRLLVRVLYRFTAVINQMFHNEISGLYHRDDIVGKLSKVYLAAPLSPSKIPNSPVQPELLKSLRTPRISLRFLGSYQTLLYMTLMYGFLRLSFGIGPFGYVMILLLSIIVYGFFRAFMTEENSNSNVLFD
ncbi:sphingomyelin phosphodiesterase 4 [Mactra antiquata]